MTNPTPPQKTLEATKNCPACNKDFVPVKASRVFCSNICSAARFKKENPSYGAIHEWLRAKNKKLNKCEFCHRTDIRTVWAKKTDSEYTRNREDYYELCYSCHTSYDMTDEGRKNRSKAHQGTKAPWKNVPIIATKGDEIIRLASQREAEHVFGVARWHISNCLLGKKDNIKGYKLTRG